MLTNEERARWQREGYLVVSDAIAPDQQRALPEWADKLRSRVPRSGEPNPLIHERVSGRIVATERGADHLDALSALVRGGPLCEIATVLLGEPAVLHSDLVRFDTAVPVARQLVATAKYIDRYLGCVVAIDPLDAGEFEVATGVHDRRLDADRAGNIEPRAAAGLPWVSVVLDAGDTLWLHRFTPHRLLAQRRTLELAYSARVQGDLRAAHYVLRRRQMLGSDNNNTTGAWKGARKKGS